MTRLKYLPNVVSLAYDQQKCTGCRKCVEVCPHGVFVVENKKAQIVDFDMCMECGACSRNCVSEAITVQSGVGCAAGVIKGMLKGAGPACDCMVDGDSCC